jgi:UDP-N-acetylglucosamine 2-epimerase (non-hydrolysing)
MVNILHVVGARPNFMKAASVVKALNSSKQVHQVLVHSGQHYDGNMSEIFFHQLGLPEPDINLEVGSGTHAVQTAQIMIRLEPVLLHQKPDIVLVYGDVNSTVAAALVCAKLLIPVGHVEAGLRSFDRSMPEEINRLLTDQISDFLFTPSEDGNKNLIREGIPDRKIYFVGNVMIDTLIRLLPRAQSRWKHLHSRLYVENGSFGLVTLHRPSNVDEKWILKKILLALDWISKLIPLVFTVHPRTKNRIHDMNIITNNKNLQMVEPLGYLDFLALQKHAKMLITDSGGIQEETTFLGVPCLTVRENTERPVTVKQGTNILVGQDMDCLKREVKLILDGQQKSSSIPRFWDGSASERIADIISRNSSLDTT